MRPHTPTRMDKGTSTSPPSLDGGTTPPISLTASRQGDDLHSTWDQPRQEVVRLAERMAPRRVQEVAPLPAEPIGPQAPLVAAPRVEQEPRTPPAWAGTLAQRRDDLDAHLGLTTSQPVRSDLHRAVRGMPEIADRLTERWARKTERGLPNALTEYKELAMQLSESRGSLQETRPSRPQTPPRMDKEARPNSRPKSAPKERRPELSVHAKRQAEDAPRGPVLLHGLPGQRMEKRAAERAERERRKGQMLKEELARSPRPEREELARLSSQRSRSTLDREEKTSPGRVPAKAPAQTGPKSAARPAANGKREAMPADLFEIPEQLREARRRTTELEAQLAELRKRLQLQENRSAAMLTPAGLTVVAPPGPGTPLAPGRAPGGGAFPTPRVGDTVYVNAAGAATTVSTMDGGRTPSRYSLPVDGTGPPAPTPAVHPTSRSLSPPRWSQAPTMGWTWPEKGAIYAAPATVRAPLRVASTSPTRVLHMSPSPPRVASPIRFIAQTPPGPPLAPPLAMGAMGAMARPMATLPTATTFWFPRTVSVSPQPGRQAAWHKGEPNLAKEPANPQSCTEGWAALSEPTSSL